MNEQIKKLALQAEKIVKSKYPNDDMNVGVARMMDVFGELIVRECVDVIDDTHRREGINIFIIDKIKQHFGVEE